LLALAQDAGSQDAGVEPESEDESSAAAAAVAGPPAGATPAQRDAWLAARDGDDAFNVASNAKLVTAAAALAKLGPEYRFRTALYADERNPAAKPRPGIPAGDLVLRGGGDPLLDT